MQIDISVARNWVDTPFLQNGTTRHGCDCLGLIIGVLCEQGYDIKPEEYLSLTRYNHINRDNALCALEKYCTKIENHDPGAGDIAVFSHNKNTIHFGIISQTDPLQIIHAHQAAGRVVETILDSIWSRHFLYCVKAKGKNSPTDQAHPLTETQHDSSGSFSQIMASVSERDLGTVKTVAKDAD